jgi:hypothetical protein
LCRLSWGQLQEALNGISFSNAFNVVPIRIAALEVTFGYVDGLDAGVTEIQSFMY